VQAGKIMVGIDAVIKEASHEQAESGK